MPRASGSVASNASAALTSKLRCAVSRRTFRRTNSARWWITRLDSAGLRTASPEAAAWLSLVAYVRHTFTDYDERLEQGYDRDSARFFVADEINNVLQGWGAKRRLSEQD